MSVWQVTATSAPARGREPNPDMIRRFFAIAFDPDRTYELRFLPSGWSRSVSLRDLPGAVATAVELTRSNLATYYTLNPISPELGDRAAKDVDVLSRHWILVDVDPAKAITDASATDDEKRHAVEMAGRIREFLTSMGFPEPVVIDSGNGVHLLYRCDLPNDSLSRILISGFLKALAVRFNSSKATVDRSVHNASRIAKLPGTWAQKGDDEPGIRPHRLCEIVSAPESIGVVSASQIESLSLQLADSGKVDKAESEVARPGENDPLPMPMHCWKVVATKKGDMQTEYALAALEQECLVVSQTVKPGRGDAINRAAFNLGQLVTVGAIAQTTVEKRLVQAGKATGLPTKEINHSIRRGLAAGMARPRIIPPLDAPEVKLGPGVKLPEGTSVLAAIMRTEADTDPDDPTVGAETITAKAVRWLWAGRIPYGKLTTMAGPGGLGKSFVTCRIAATISTGGEWPYAEGECADRGGVLIINSEDAPDDTLVPRLIEMGADRTKIRFMKASVLGGFKLQDLDTLHKAVSRTPDCRLIVIDPAPSHIGGVDDNGNTPLRGVLTPLSLYVAAMDLACVLVTHVGKPKSNSVSASHTILGSVAWVNAVRSVLLFAKDPDHPGEVLILTVKNNLAPPQLAVAYRLEKTETLATIEWTGLRDVDNDEVVEAKPKDKFSTVNQAEKAADWLRTWLAAGDCKGEICIEEGNKFLGTERPFRWWLDTVLKARLQGSCKKIGFGAEGEWHWTMPRSIEGF